VSQVSQVSQGFFAVKTEPNRTEPLLIDEPS
jgi:hypothetical protein